MGLTLGTMRRSVCIQGGMRHHLWGLLPETSEGLTCELLDLWASEGGNEEAGLDLVLHQRCCHDL